jgi:hypothetical protein
MKVSDYVMVATLGLTGFAEKLDMTNAGSSGI